ncbi:hypothetical protein A2996_02800 [Candidatus Campbellbacteria bacterium RIFCSPLOWO2_01_FULL_34_15]|uniref:DUF1653 domain-containing protein n=2 Tax=Candidatus Campbelliibacteriota TaxID=1752727 RepID=A0A1F5EP10_9BACT|nr:MAG: hypothetical protein A2811_01310 [Candidatus Campbellbacteria bacterium RIFCSPHIGHO2_01_FULL_34_10]OGD69123.1 MAG: hypothetical protein A2996_02800 [Candidatus Campbellbacteria bacterium RIFCSPLOWO2_01_FULL_34_15]
MQKLEIVGKPISNIFIALSHLLVDNIHNTENPEDIFGAIILLHQQVKKDILLDGHYRHFKGGEYETVGLGFREKTQEWIVVYRSLYDSKDYPKGTLWGRLEDDFIGFHKSGVRRFVYIGK